MTSHDPGQPEPFTWEAYRRYLLAACDAGYAFVGFDRLRPGSAPPPSPFLLLRHDIDFDPVFAPPLARAEEECGARSTWFLQPDSPHYRLEEAASIEAIEGLVAAGHHLGLHFDAGAIDDDGEVVARVEAAATALERRFGASVHAVSFHNPGHRAVAHLALAHERVNTYDPDVFRDVEYVSDSNQGWRGKDLMRILVEARPAAIQLLTHPVWWRETYTPFRTVLQEIADRRGVDLETDILTPEHRSLLARAGSSPGAGKLVAIHQPNFFPWLGYFDKIARADAFCLLDNVQFPKKGGTWINRVRIAIGERDAWVTVPVERTFHGVRSIREITIDDTTPWRDAIKSTVRMSYRRAACFGEAWPLVEGLIDHREPSLAACNEQVIRRLCVVLGLDETRLVRGSTLPVEGRATDLLVNIVRALEGEAYLCGGGAGGYQEDEKFEAAGIALVHQEFDHPEYERGGAAFRPGLSIIDALMHCGIEGTRDLLAGAVGSRR